MLHRRRILVIAVVFNLLCLTSVSSFSQSGNTSQDSGKPATIEELIDAGNKAIRQAEWANAESNFREAIRLEPKQGLWRIQLLIIFGHQKKWKHAFRELDKLAELKAIDWVISINKKLPEGKVAFVHANTFRDEKQGILRYLRAVIEKKKVESVAEDIGDKLEKFAKERGIALVYDMDKLQSKRFEGGNAIDLTSEFIAYYNERHED